jgi:mono/diheme cytochrome c family protein
MRLLRSRLFQAVAVLVIAFCIFRFGIQPPAPWSVIRLYMAIVALAVLVYVSSDSDSWRDFLRPIRDTMVRRDRWLVRGALIVLIPLLLGYYAYTVAAARPEAPPQLRAIHPAPPSSMPFRGKEMNLQGLENPLRKDQASFARHAAAGGAIYVQNCVFCHGDNLDGKGHFAAAFNPPPANFEDPGTIAQLPESYLFWRIAKGGPGLPRESTPWDSVMPAWEDRLTEEQIWQVIIYLYDATGQHPRRWGEH